MMYKELMMCKELIKKHEGFRFMPYKDTKGILTIGYGYNLTEGISQETAEFLLDEQIGEATKDCLTLFSNFKELNTTRTAVLINMAYNMGRSRLGSFKKMIAAVENNNFKIASIEMLDSKWAKIDVGQRAVELADYMKEGEF